MNITTSDAFARLEAAAHESAFGFGKQPPTKAQCEAANYKVGRINWAGLDLCIEQPRGSVREKCSRDGKQWRNVMGAHYGYIADTKGADGDAVDCFIGPSVASQNVFVINQGFSGRFDEHKVMLCFDDIDSARSAYMSSYASGWAGLQEIVPCSLTQLKWWLKYGDNTQPIQSANLPHEGVTMSRIHWTQDALPANTTLDQLIYGLRREDGNNELLMDSVTVDEILADPDNTGVLVLDGLTMPYQRVERRMSALQRFMDRVIPELRVMQMQVSTPFKRQGTVNVAVVYELSDGQTISVYLHNPDTTPAKLAPLDELISWKWLLNKKDVTIVVAPERGVDLQVNEVARRLMRLANKNSAAFQRANAKRAESMQEIQALEAEVKKLESTLEQQQKDLEVARLKAEEGTVVQPDPAPQPEPQPQPDPLANWLPKGWTESTPGGMATKPGPDGGIVDIAPATGKWFVIFHDEFTPQADGFDSRQAAFNHFLEVIRARLNPETHLGYMQILGSGNDRNQALAERYQDVLDNMFQGRILAVRNALRGMGWEGEEFGELSKNGAKLEMDLWKVGAGGNIAGVTYRVTGEGAKEEGSFGTRDTLSVTPEVLAQELNDFVQEKKAPMPEVVQRDLNMRARELFNTLKSWGFSWLGAFMTNEVARVFYAAGDIDTQRYLGLDVTPFSRFTIRGPGAPEGVVVADDLSKTIEAVTQELSEAIKQASAAPEQEQPQPQALTFEQWLAGIVDGAESVAAMNASAAEQGAQIQWYVPGTAPVFDSATEAHLDSAFAHAIASLAITAQVAAGNAPIYMDEGNEEQAKLSAEVAQSALLAKEVLASLDSDSVALLGSIKLDAAGNPANVCGYVMLGGKLVGLVEIDSAGGVMVYRGNQTATPLMAMRARREAAGWAVKMLLDEVKGEQSPVVPAEETKPEETKEPEMKGPVFAEGDYLTAQFTNISKLGTLDEYLQPGRARVKTLVKVQKALKLTNEQFDEFANNLLESRSDLGKGGTATDSPLITQEDMGRSLSEMSPEKKAEWERTAYRLGTVVMAPDRATIVVDPQGYDYARYVGINPEPASAPVLGEQVEPEKTKRATKKEVRDVYDRISWSITDLAGHTPAEYRRASTHYLEEGIREAQALLERGMPNDMRGVPDLAYMIAKGQEAVEGVKRAGESYEQALELLTSVIDGTTPPEAADIRQLIKVGQDYRGDTDIQELLGQATKVINAYEMSATQNLH